MSIAYVFADRHTHKNINPCPSLLVPASPCHIIMDIHSSAFRMRDASNLNAAGSDIEEGNAGMTPTMRRALENFYSPYTADLYKVLQREDGTGITLVNGISNVY